MKLPSKSTGDNNIVIGLKDSRIQLVSVKTLFSFIFWANIVLGERKPCLFLGLDADISDMSNFSLTENVLNPTRDCSWQGEFVGKLDKATNKSSNIVFDIYETPIATL